VILVAVLAGVIYAFMIVEARRAARNERSQRARGGVEPSGDVYAWMQLAYPALFAAMLVEGLRRSTAPSAAIAAGAVLFAVAKALKWWAILTLGPFWTFRVVIVPGSVPVANGPYVWMRHPNYVGVVGEIVGAALMMNARLTGPLALLVFGVLLVRRIVVEDRARDAILRRR
jgi:methyltransferase